MGPCPLTETVCLDDEQRPWIVTVAPGKLRLPARSRLVRRSRALHAAARSVQLSMQTLGMVKPESVEIGVEYFVAEIIRRRQTMCGYRPLRPRTWVRHWRTRRKPSRKDHFHRQRHRGGRHTVVAMPRVAVSAYEDVPRRPRREGHQRLAIPRVTPCLDAPAQPAHLPGRDTVAPLGHSHAEKQFRRW